MLTSKLEKANVAKNQAINDRKEALYNLELANIRQEQTKGLLEEMQQANEELRGEVAKHQRPSKTSFE